MKKIILFIFTVLCVYQSQACEICGCGVGNFYLGMTPNFSSKFIGIRYRYIGYSTHMHDDPAEFSYDRYQTVELWGGWKLSDRWQAIAFVPYQFNERVTNESTKSIANLGDITLLGNYKIHSSPTSSWWIGAGIKLPTGKYKIDFNDSENNTGDPNAMAGSGSVDYLLNINHLIKWGSWGINTSASYKLNSQNPDKFKFGNRFIINSIAFHQLNIRDIKVVPTAGVIYEHSAQNQLVRESLEFTGGYSLFGVSGVELSFQKITLGFNFQIPVSQNLSGNQTKNNLRSLIHLTLTL